MRLAVVLVVGTTCLWPVGAVASGARRLSGRASTGTLPSVRMDFNGDGLGDLAIGVPNEAVGTVTNAGAVNVIYGSTGGLSATATPDQFWTQNTPNVAGVADVDDAFGKALAAGDFNGDGVADLAIGVPFEDIAGLDGAGAVNVIYGSAGGLSATATPDQFWSQDSANVNDACEFDDEFGAAVAAVA